MRRGCCAAPATAILCAAVALTGVTPSARAQLPGESVYSSKMSMRQEFLAHAYEEVRATLDLWQQSLRVQRVKDLVSILADEVIFTPVEGWTARGKADAADSLTRYVPRLSAYGLTPIDFDASGGLAYVFGATHYQIGVPGNGDRRTVTAEVVIVLVQRGPTWKLRSYVERRDPTSGPP